MPCINVKGVSSCGRGEANLLVGCKQKAEARERFGGGNVCRLDVAGGETCVTADRKAFTC